MSFALLPDKTLDTWYLDALLLSYAVLPSDSFFQSNKLSYIFLLNILILLQNRQFYFGDLQQNRRFWAFQKKFVTVLEEFVTVLLKMLDK